MNTTTAATSKTLAALRQRDHSTCMLCRPDNPGGLQLHCEARPDGSVRGSFTPQSWMTGFDGQIHGGILCCLLDSAMVQCLFAQGISAVTALLNVRFRHPVPRDQTLTVTAKLNTARHGRYRLTAQIQFNGKIMADAEATFVQRKDAAAEKGRQRDSLF